MKSCLGADTATFPIRLFEVTPFLQETGELIKEPNMGDGRAMVSLGLGRSSGSNPFWVITRMLLDVLKYLI